MATTHPNPTYPATGRRKCAVARVQIVRGPGEITVNGRPFEEYFPTLTLQNIVLQPLQALGLLNQIGVRASTHGGGPTGQAGAVRLAIARALVELDPEHRAPLRKEALLTRDPRMKERKKAGQPGARKRFQFSKR